MAGRDCRQRVAAEPPTASLVDAAYRTMRATHPRQRLATRPPRARAGTGARARHEPHAGARGADPPRAGGPGRGRAAARHARAARVGRRHERDLRSADSLESTAAEMLAQRKPGGARHCSRWSRRLARRWTRALKADDLDAWAAADERFHRHLVELCGNRLLAATVCNFWDRAHRARMFTLRLRPKPVHSTREHMRCSCARSAQATPPAAREIHRAHRERATPRAHRHPRALPARSNCE